MSDKESESVEMESIDDEGILNPEDSEDEEATDLANKTEKNFKYGIIYLSYIPDGLNVKIIREIMSDFGEVGRIYLEPEQNNKKHRTFLEGWVEFKKKRVAKSVAKKLNGTALQYGRKHCKMNGQIWSVKYLHRFKWAHLTEQLRLDRQTKEQKRRFEMSQTKKQVDFYQKMTERSRKLSKFRSKEPSEKVKDKIKTIESRQNRPITDGHEFEVNVDEDLLSSIFKKVS